MLWRNKCHGGDRPDTNALADFLVLIGHDVPSGAGRGNVGTTIGRVRQALRKGRGIDGTDDQRRRWRDLRDHNRHDCAGMRKVCVQAATAVAAAIEHAV